MRLIFSPSEIKKTVSILILATFFSFDCFARSELQTYKCEIIGMLENGNPIVTSIPSPVSVNHQTVNHVLYVNFESVETLRVGFSPYEGQLHILAEKKNSSGRYRSLFSTKVQLGSPKVSLDLNAIEGVTAFITCILEKTISNEEN